MFLRLIFNALAIVVPLCYGGAAAAATCAGLEAAKTHQEFSTFVQTHTLEDVPDPAQHHALAGLALMKGQMLAERKRVFRRHLRALSRQVDDRAALAKMIRDGDGLGFSTAVKDKETPRTIAALSDVYWLSGCPALARAAAWKLAVMFPDQIQSSHLIRLMGAMTETQTQDIVKVDPRSGLLEVFALRLSAADSHIVSDLDAIHQVITDDENYRPAMAYLRALAHHLWSVPEKAAVAASDYSKSLMFSQLTSGEEQYLLRSELAWVQAAFDHCDDRTMGPVPAMLQSPWLLRFYTSDHLLSAHLLCAANKG